VVLRGAEYVLHAERAAGAPEAAYVAECLQCRAESGLVDYDPKPVAVWSIEHTRHYGLAHSQFLVTTQRHWRVGPLPPPSPPAPAPCPRAHARARTPLAEPLIPITLIVAVMVLLCVGFT
jgi:hypothetical protein